ncbi:hypothetical protein [Streptomyces sp. NPDC020917]|uniref:hypothetical protein n=1 Tax=Streptomyces sp. NPDC020917 TaxID=3365102 RepID=UPI003787553B
MTHAADGGADRGGGRDGDAALDALGPFFTIGRHDPAHPPAGDWRSVTDLVTDPSVLDERVASVREFLAAGGGLDVARIEVRVAASVAHLGMAARLVSPLLATAVLHRRVPALSLDDLRWKAQLGGAFPLSLPRAGGGTGETAGVAGGDGAAVEAACGEDPGRELDDNGPLPACLTAVLVDGIAVPLAGAFGRFGVSEHILRGNTSSALAGAARMLAGRGAGTDARALLGVLLRHPYLAGSGGFGPRGAFRRSSCCLIYRAAPDRNGSLCGDCALDHRPTAARGKRVHRGTD